MITFHSFIMTLWRMLHIEQGMLTLKEHLISPLVFIEVRVFLSFVSPFIFKCRLLIVPFSCLHFFKTNIDPSCGTEQYNLLEVCIFKTRAITGQILLEFRPTV